MAEMPKEWKYIHPKAWATMTNNEGEMTDIPKPAFIVRRCVQYEGQPAMIYATGENPARALEPLFTASQVAELMEEASKEARWTDMGECLAEFRAAYCK